MHQLPKQSVNCPIPTSAASDGMSMPSRIQGLSLTYLRSVTLGGAYLVKDEAVIPYIRVFCSASSSLRIQIQGAELLVVYCGARSMDMVSAQEEYFVTDTCLGKQVIQVPHVREVHALEYVVHTSTLSAFVHASRTCFHTTAT